MLAEELGDLRVLEGLARVWDVVLQEVVQLIFVGKELQRCDAWIVGFEAVHYIVGPVQIPHVDKVVCQGGEDDKECKGLLREGRL